MKAFFLDLFDGPMGLQYLLVTCDTHCRKLRISSFVFGRHYPLKTFMCYCALLSALYCSTTQYHSPCLQFFHQQQSLEQTFVLFFFLLNVFSVYVSLKTRYIYKAFAHFSSCIHCLQLLSPLTDLRGFYPFKNHCYLSTESRK